MAALSKPLQLRVLVALSHQPMQEKELVERLESDKSATSHALTNLKTAGLIDKASVQSPYDLVLPDLITDLIRRANRLGLQLSEGRFEADSELREALPTEPNEATDQADIAARTAEQASSPVTVRGERARRRK